MERRKGHAGDDQKRREQGSRDVVPLDGDPTEQRKRIPLGQAARTQTLVEIPPVVEGGRIVHHHHLPAVEHADQEEDVAEEDDDWQLRDDTEPQPGSCRPHGVWRRHMRTQATTLASSTLAEIAAAKLACGIRQVNSTSWRPGGTRTLRKI